MTFPSSIEPPKGLKSQILSSISREERTRAKKYLVLATLVIPVSVFFVVLSIRYMISGFFESSFHSYFSLVFSDPDIVLVYWKEFIQSLVESVSIMSIIASLFTITVFLILVRTFLHNQRNSFTLKYINS